MARKVVCVAVVVLGCLSIAASCSELPPQRIAVSPDGQTMYFCLNAFGGFEKGETSRMYALSLTRPRLDALGDTRGAIVWGALAPGGGTLFYMHEPRSGGRISVEGYNFSPEHHGFLVCGGGSQSSGCPWVIPGDPPHLLILTGSFTENFHWCLYEIGLGGGFTPVGLSIPASAAICTGAATAPNRFAVLTGQEIGRKEAREVAKRRWEFRVFVVDIKRKQRATGQDEKTQEVWETNVTEAARWQVDERSDARYWYLLVDLLASSPDGSRLLAIRYEATPETSIFLEVDPTGRIPARTLFRDQKVCQTRWVPDENAVAYVRVCPENSDWRELVVRNLDTQKSLVLARLPGAPSQASTDWRWDWRGVVTVYHLSNEGVRVVTSNADGTKGEAKLPSHEKLRVQKHLADLELALKGMAEPREQGLGAGDSLKAVYEPVCEKAFGEEALRVREAAWDKVDDWETVPPVPAVPKQEPQPEFPDIPKPGSQSK